MQAGFLKVGESSYVNPRYITRIEPSCDLENQSWVHTTDGKYVESDYDYTPEKLIKDLEKLDFYA